MLTSQTITLCPISVVFTVNQNSLGEKKTFLEKWKERKRKRKGGGGKLHEIKI
jgi:hypothetical protein